MVIFLRKLDHGLFSLKSVVMANSKYLLNATYVLVTVLSNFIFEKESTNSHLLHIFSHKAPLYADLPSVFGVFRIQMASHM